MGGYCFTVQCDNAYHLPLVKAHVGPFIGAPLKERNIKRLEKIAPIDCCFDTGANNTAINRATVKKLGLVPLKETATIVSINATQTARMYKVDILLPNGLLIVNHTVSEIESPIDMFIGMDIIRAGDFALTNRQGKMLLSFRIPNGNPIDFEEQ